MTESWTQITIEVAPAQVDIVTDVMTECGALAVTLQDGLDEKIYEPPPGTTPLWQHTRVTGLYEQGRQPRELLQAIAEALPEQFRGALQTERLADRDWLRVCMDQFEPRCFAGRLWICPSWSDSPQAAQGGDQAVVLLDPGLAFGTGSHPTTALCLQQLAQLEELQGRHVIDWGCGSGILAIAAVKLGAAHVVALDIDAQAILATTDNAVQNGVAEQITTRVPAAAPDAIGLPVCAPADVLLANILAGPLIELAGVICRHLRPGGQLILSGILDSQADAVAAAYAPWVDVRSRSDADGWVCLVATAHNGTR